MIVSRRGSLGDHRARRLVPLSGRQGARPLQVMYVREERPVDTIAGARKVAEERA
jgi:hypothetical protein